MNANATGQPNPKSLLLILILFVAVAAAGAGYLYYKSDWRVPAQMKKVENPVPVSKEAIGAGMMIYMENCQNCHGENGDGKGPKAEKLSIAPANFTDARAMSRLTDGELFWQITHGHRPMPAFQDKLTDQERWQSVIYIRTFAQKPLPSTPGTP